MNVFMHTKGEAACFLAISIILTCAGVDVLYKMNMRTGKG